MDPQSRTDSPEDERVRNLEISTSSNEIRDITSHKKISILPCMCGNAPTETHFLNQPAVLGLCVFYVCPQCSPSGVSRWKQKCRLDGCMEPASIDPRSKYCSEQHGIEFARRLANAADGISKGQLKSVVTSCGSSSELCEALWPQDMAADAMDIEYEDPAVHALENELARLASRKARLERCIERTTAFPRLCLMDLTLLSDDMHMHMHAAHAHDPHTDANVCLRPPSECREHRGWKTDLLVGIKHSEQVLSGQLEALKQRLAAHHNSHAQLARINDIFGEAQIRVSGLEYMPVV